MDVDLRKLRYFVAVAECAGFRKASDRLHVAQPALTRQIRSFEGEMDAELFIRSTQGVTLTEAGQQLLEEAETLLASANAMQRRLAELKTRAPRLTVGFAQGIPIAAIIRQFSSRHPTVEVDLVSVPASQQSISAVDGQVDVCFGRAPMVGTGLEVVPLFEEPCVVAMPSDDPLSRVEYLELRDLVGFPLLQDPASVPEIGIAVVSSQRAYSTKSGDQRFSISTTDEALEHVAVRHGIVVLPSSVASAYSRPDISYRRVDGLLPSSVVLAYASERSTRHIRSLVEIATHQTQTIGTP